VIFNISITGLKAGKGDCKRSENVRRRNKGSDSSNWKSKHKSLALHIQYSSDKVTPLGTKKNRDLIRGAL